MKSACLNTNFNRQPIVVVIFANRCAFVTKHINFNPLPL